MWDKVQKVLDFGSPIVYNILIYDEKSEKL